MQLNILRICCAWFLCGYGCSEKIENGMKLSISRNVRLEHVSWSFSTYLHVFGTNSKLLFPCYFALPDRVLLRAIKSHVPYARQRTPCGSQGYSAWTGRRPVTQTGRTSRPPPAPKKPPSSASVVDTMRLSRATWRDAVVMWGTCWRHTSSILGRTGGDLRFQKPCEAPEPLFLGRGAGFREASER